MNKIKNIILIVIFLIISIIVLKGTYVIFVGPAIRSMPPILFTSAFIGIQFLVFIESLVLVYLAARFIDKTSLSEVGINFTKQTLKHFSTGTILAVLAALITWASYMILNSPSYTCKINSFFIIMMVSILSIPAAFFQTTAEEFLFRTWVLKRLGDTLSPTGAIIAMGLIFGGLHLLNPNYSVFAAFNAGLAGVVTSLAFFRTKSVWMSSGIHFGWNYMLGIVYSSTFFEILSKGQKVNMFSGAEGTFSGCLTIAILIIIVFIITGHNQITYKK